MAQDCDIETKSVEISKPQTEMSSPYTRRSYTRVYPSPFKTPGAFKVPSLFSRLQTVDAKWHHKQFRAQMKNQMASKEELRVAFQAVMDSLFKMKDLMTSEQKFRVPFQPVIDSLSRPMHLATTDHSMTMAVALIAANDLESSGLNAYYPASLHLQKSVSLVPFDQLEQSVLNWFVRTLAGSVVNFTNTVLASHRSLAGDAVAAVGFLTGFLVDPSSQGNVQQIHGAMALVVGVACKVSTSL